MHRTARTASPVAGTVRFSDHEFDLDSRELRRAGVAVPLRPQAAIVLERLVLRYPGMVTREELRRALWGAAAVEWETGIHQVVRQLRQALGDDSTQPSFIETVPRRGYRFAARVSTRPTAAARVRSATRDLAIWFVGVLSLPVLAVLACLLLAS